MNLKALLPFLLAPMIANAQSIHDSSSYNEGVVKPSCAPWDGPALFVEFQSKENTGRLGVSLWLEQYKVGNLDLTNDTGPGGSIGSANICEGNECKLIPGAIVHITSVQDNVPSGYVTFKQKPMERFVFNGPVVKPKAIMRCG